MLIYYYSLSTTDGRKLLFGYDESETQTTGNMICKEIKEGD